MTNGQAGRDENHVTKEKNLFVSKAANLLTSLVSGGTHATAKSDDANMLPTSESQNDMRNALGDIGNTLTCSININMNAQNPKKQQQPLVPPKPVVLPEIVVEPASSNNSCSMIEVESSEDEEEEETEEEEEDEEEVDLSELESEDGKEAVGELGGESVVFLDEDEDEEEVLRALTFPKDVEDIDEEDKDNPQLLADYVKDIYYYLHHIEKKYRVSPNFMDTKIVTVKMRAILMDWLTQVHLKFHLLNETLFLTCQIIDAYLEVSATLIKIIKYNERN